MSTVARNDEPVQAHEYIRVVGGLNDANGSSLKTAFAAADIVTRTKYATRDRQTRV